MRMEFVPFMVCKDSKNFLASNNIPTKLSYGIIPFYCTKNSKRIIKSLLETRTLSLVKKIKDIICKI